MKSEYIDTRGTLWVRAALPYALASQEETIVRRHQRPAPNPWVKPQVKPVESPTSRAAVLEPDDLFGDRVSVTGPAEPLGLPLTNGDSRLRRAVLQPDGRIHVVGLHGGAGATTVTRLLGAWTARDTDGVTPMGEPGERAPRVLWVARTSGIGLDAASRAAHEWASGMLDDIELLGLMLVADGPKLPTTLRREALRVAHTTPRCWRLAWREDWRAQAVADLSSQPTRLRRSLAEITDSPKG